MSIWSSLASSTFQDVFEWNIREIDEDLLGIVLFTFQISVANLILLKIADIGDFWPKNSDLSPLPPFYSTVGNTDLSSKNTTKVGPGRHGATLGRPWGDPGAAWGDHPENKSGDPGFLAQKRTRFWTYVRFTRVC